jgi:hypothetical protein
MRLSRQSDPGGIRYWQVKSVWHTPPAPQSELVKHSTHACVVVSQTGRVCGQFALVVHVPPQVCPLEQTGVPVEQSAFVKQSTQT